MESLQRSKLHLKSSEYLFNFILNISRSNRERQPCVCTGYRTTDRRFDVDVHPPIHIHAIREIKFVFIDTHVSARGRIYLPQSQHRICWRTHILHTRRYIHDAYIRTNDEHKRRDYVSDRRRRRVECEVLFDRESPSWKMIETHRRVGRKTVAGNDGNGANWEFKMLH